MTKKKKILKKKIEIKKVIIQVVIIILPLTHLVLQKKINHILRGVPPILEAEIILLQVVAPVSVEVVIQRIQMKKKETK